jgi:Zn-dependent M28 family amino/carboxypeptidase
MKQSILIAALAATLLAGPVVAQQSPAQTIVALRDKALTDPVSWDLLESLTTEIGPRPAGSPAQMRARDWGLAKLRALGFQNVHAEEFPVTSWERGVEFAEVTTPFPQKLALLGLGGSISTPPGGIEAEIVVFKAYADLLAAPAGSLTGKIAVVTQKMVRAQDGSGYGAINAARRAGASEAARRGAVAYLVRSLSTDDTRLPHAGAMNYTAGVAKIPAAAISTPDADLLDNMVRRGKPVKVKLVLNSISRDNAPAWNVVGEIPGTKPDEIILVGGHLDSWDAGTGAIDDGAGIAITTAAAHLAGQPNKPRRTIRVVMFGAEEMDYSGAAYSAAHKAENIVLISESDNGGDNIWSVRLPPGGREVFAPLASVFAPLKINIAADVAVGGGDDIRPLITATGAPSFNFRQDASRYFDLHHSADDTLDKVDPKQLNQNVAAWAALLYLAANSDQSFRKAP